MCYDGVWGTVCSDYWGTPDSNIVCRQLGYSSSGIHNVRKKLVGTDLISLGAVPRANAVYGQGIGPIILDDVQCSGFEHRLFECPHRGLEVHDCNHQDDAGVVCSAGKK